MFSFLHRDRFVVATLCVALPKGDASALHARALQSVRAIAADGTDFARASAETAALARALLDREHMWSHVGGFGDVYDREEDAAVAADAAYADAAGRYLSSADDGPATAGARAGHIVLLLTVAYAGEAAQIERPIASRDDLHGALLAVAALHDDDKLLVAHVHVSPGHPDDAVTEEQLLASFPELLSA